MRSATASATKSLISSRVAQGFSDAIWIDSFSNNSMSVLVFILVISLLFRGTLVLEEHLRSVSIGAVARDEGGLPMRIRIRMNFRFGWRRH